MQQITFGVTGMMCSHCEKRCSEAIKNAAATKKFEVSSVKKQAVVVCDDAISPDVFKAAIEKAGYAVVSVETAPYVKKGLFG